MLPAARILLDPRIFYLAESKNYAQKKKTAAGITIDLHQQQYQSGDLPLMFCKLDQCPLKLYCDKVVVMLRGRSSHSQFSMPHLLRLHTKL